MVYSPVEQASRDENMTSGSMTRVNVQSDSTGAVDDDEAYDYANEEIVKFVKSTFKKRTCRRFVPEKSDDASSLCKCGYATSRHPKDRGNASQSPWTVESDTVLSPTDAFGEAEFVISGQKICKYIRVDYETKAEDLMTLLLKHWKLELPNLLISVTGGAEKFTMQPRLREVFRQGLVKAAESTRAWIITGGTNTGVMKHVGEALRDYTIKYGTKKQLVALGIATWGCIENRDDLIPDEVKENESKESNGCWPASYKVIDSPDKKRESPLDPNHTHFILVDNGTQKKFGVEIGLRARLESEISKRKSDEKSITIPVVLVVLEGGPNTLETIKKAIEQGTPAIIVAGSGRAADVMAFAYERYKELRLDSKESKEEARQSETAEKEAGFWEEVTSEMKKKFRAAEIEKCVGHVRACIANMNHLTVFRLDSGYSAKDIDIAILKALLKVNQDKQLDQMRLALAWDRVDIAKEEIYTENVHFKDEELHELMYSAIVKDRVDFVKLFLDKGLNLKDFLTTNRFLDLYSEPLTIERCPQLLKKKKRDRKLSMKDIGSLIKELSGELFESSYSSDQIPNQNRNSKRITLPLQQLSPIGTVSSCPSDDPSRDLFIWSVLTQRKDMAMAFWYEGREDLALAVVAHLLLSNLLLSDPDPEINQELSEQIAFYEELGVGLLKECHSSDQRKSIQLLVREIPAFGRTTVLKMAVQADNKSFISLPACQNLLTEAWTGKLSDDNHYVKLLLSTFLPFIAPFLLKFREKEGKQIDRQNALGSSMTTKRDSQADLMNTRVAVRSADQQSDSEKNSVATYFQKMASFFQAPVIKFCYNCVTYFAFLLLFGVILLTDFYPHISIKECILIAWVVTLIFEELRQIAMDDARDVVRKLYNYITDIWNIMDVITIVTFLAGMILRFIPVSICGQCFYAARIILAMNFMTFFFRVLHMFSIHRELGPKLVMIGKMMIDLFYFMIILLVFIAAYGIASHVILYPNQPLNIALARDVLSRSWWNIFGELGIEEVSGQACSNDTALPYAEQCASLDEEEFSSYGCSDYKEDQCPSIDWLVPIILAIYVLITNVLMLNLLIAMFSNTFSNIQGQTNVVWKMQRYHLVREYESRPMLPPPLIVFAHFIQLIRYVIRRQNNTRCPKYPSKFRLTFKAQSAEEKDLLNWENVNAEEYLRKTDSNDRETTEKNASDRLESILRKVEEISEKIPLLENLEKRLNQIENQLSRR